MGIRREERDMFQFLDRNSVDLDSSPDLLLPLLLPLFQFLDRNSVDLDIVSQAPLQSPVMVSIPRSEFCGFRLRLMRLPYFDEKQFQFPDRNSVDLDPAEMEGQPLV